MSFGFFFAMLMFEIHMLMPPFFTISYAKSAAVIRLRYGRLMKEEEPPAIIDAAMRR